MVAGALAVGACDDAEILRPPPPTASVDAGGADASPDDVLRMATFNVRRFFDTTCDTGMCASGDYEEQPSEAEYRLDVERIARGVEELDADIVALEEIETQACLDDVVAELAKSGLDYPIAVLGETGGAASVDVAILARGSSPDVRRHRQDPITRPDGSETKFSRELLEVRMTVGGAQVVALAAHFRSQNDDDPGRRLAEANATRQIIEAIDEELPSALVVLGGDLNDEPGSDALVALEGGGALVRVARDRPPYDQATYEYQGTPQAIDHLFVPAGDADRYVEGSASVVRDANRRGLGGSDHAALRASFTFK